MTSLSATSHGRFVMFAVTKPTTPRAGRMVRPVNAANTPMTSLIGAFSQLTLMRGSWDCWSFAGLVVVISAWRKASCDTSDRAGVATSRSVASSDSARAGSVTGGVATGGIATGTFGAGAMTVCVFGAGAVTTGAGGTTGADATSVASRRGFAAPAPTDHGSNLPLAPSTLTRTSPLFCTTLYVCGASSVSTTRTVDFVNCE